MTSPELERLVLIGQLKREQGAQAEIDGLVRSARIERTASTSFALPPHHNDPFDRMLNAQARLEDLVPARWSSGKSGPPLEAATLEMNQATKAHRRPPNLFVNTASSAVCEGRCQRLTWK